MEALKEMYQPLQCRQVRCIPYIMLRHARPTIHSTAQHRRLSVMVSVFLQQGHQSNRCVSWNVTQSAGSLVIPKFWLQLSHVLRGGTWDVDQRRQLFLGNIFFLQNKRKNCRMRAIRSPRTSGSSKQAWQLRDYFRLEVTVPTAKNVYGCSKESQRLTQNRSQETDSLQRVDMYHVRPPLLGPADLPVEVVTIIWRLSFVFEENARKQPQKETCSTSNDDKFTVCKLSYRPWCKYCWNCRDI